MLWRKSRSIFGAKNYQYSLTGAEFAQLFASKDFSQRQEQDRKVFARQCRIRLAEKFSKLIGREATRFLFSSEVLQFLQTLGIFFQKLLQSEDLVFPQRKNEILALATVLVDGLFLADKPLRIIAPVCPDYGSGENFHQQLGTGIGNEAEAALRATNSLEELFANFPVKPEIFILTADTETDNPDILQQCSPQGVGEYLGKCQGSSQAIQTRAVKISARVKADTFSHYFGNDFHSRQNSYIQLFSQAASSGGVLAEEISRTQNQRLNRHAQILGRPEQNGELTIRYMAQYAALGTLLREPGIPTLLVNYPTPNLPYFNAKSNFQLGLSELDQKVIPVLQSVLEKHR